MDEDQLQVNIDRLASALEEAESQIEKVVRDVLGRADAIMLVAAQVYKDTDDDRLLAIKHHIDDIREILE